MLRSASQESMLHAQHIEERDIDITTLRCRCDNVQYGRSRYSLKKLEIPRVVHMVYHQNYPYDIPPHYLLLLPPIIKIYPIVLGIKTDLEILVIKDYTYIRKVIKDCIYIFFLLEN